MKAAKKKSKLPELEEERRWRRQRMYAEAKAKRDNAKLEATVPLFADQAKTTPQAEYWKRRQAHANRGGAGFAAASLANVDHRWNLRVVRGIARDHMSPEDFATADAASDRHGSVMDYWSNILTGRQRLVLDYTVVREGWFPCFDGPRPTPPVCCESGCRKCEQRILTYIQKTTIAERLVWPPAGWPAPLTKEQFDALVAVPPAVDHPDAPDPWNLRVQHVAAK